MTEIAERIDKYLSNCKTISIIGHVNPDGDCIGSVTALAMYLNGLGKYTYMICPNNAPANLDFMKEYCDSSKSTFLTYENDTEKVYDALESSDLIFCLDFNNLSRIKETAEAVRKSKAPRILIDHHPFPNEEEFAVLASQPSRSSTCELLYCILKELDSIGNRNLLDRKCCSSVFSGILTDTNIFSNSVTPETLRIAAELMEKGVDKEELQQRVTGGFSEGRLRMLGELLRNNLVYNSSKNYSYMVITEKMKKDFGYKDGDSEGFVNIPLSIKGLEVSALFSQKGEEVRVSLRSKNIPVNTFASEYFNGGGHVKASGGRITMPIGEIGKYFEESIEKYLNSIEKK